MKIAYVLAEGYTTRQNGVISQALAWKRAIEEFGHEVDLINMWDRNGWQKYDIVHYFSFSSYMKQHIERLEGCSAKVVVSPILDPDYSVWKLWLLARFGFGTMMTNYYNSFREVRERISLVLARSEFERRYLTKGIGIVSEKCHIIPLSYGIDFQVEQTKAKENFCFHCSLLADQRKNVKRLVDAAKKYGFRLVLGGYLRNDQERALIKEWIDKAENIEYVGHLSIQELMDYYSRARVFALPSTNEGVGIVGLEAAAMGCDVVLTSYGGPKEYYNGMAKIVNPYSVDEIGRAIIEFLNGDTMQPQLGIHIGDNFQLQHIAKQLEKAYNKL